MTDQIGLSKIIFINGPPFSGKTYLVSHLMDSIKNCKVVNYELFFKNGGYPAFYAEIKRLSNEGHIVIAESAMNYVGHQHKLSPSLLGYDCLFIGALPSIQEHYKNLDKFKSFAGVEAVSLRLGHFSLGDIRKIIKFPKGVKTHFYDGNNFEKIRGVVLNHVVSDEKDSRH